MAATYILADKKLNWISTECKEDKDLHSILSSKPLKNPALKGWERLFVKTLATSPNPGRRQLEKLEAIAKELNTLL